MMMDMKFFMKFFKKHFNQTIIELRNSKVRNQIYTELGNLFFGSKGGAFVSYIGGMLLFLSTQSMPGIGTDGHGSLSFGHSKYYFIVEVHPLLTKWGLFLIGFGFVLQMLDGLSTRARIVQTLIFVIPYIIMILIA